MRPTTGRDRHLHGIHRQHGGHRRRKSRYVDEALQKWLLVGLVLLEVGLVGGLTWLMRWQMDQAIESSLYRVHLAEAGPLLGQLLHDALPLLGIFLLANALAVLLAHLIWRRYLNAILRLLMVLVGKTRRLDFSLDPDRMRYRYELLTLAWKLRTKERHRLAAIREQMSRLESEFSTSGNPQSIRHRLNHLDELLPPKTRLE